MYRKIIFIFFTILPSLSNEKKTVILLFISAFSFYQTFRCRPFSLRELNILDLNSNLTALMTIFAGSLYILDINEQFKALIFVLLIIINTKFAITWFEATLEIIIYSYQHQISKICPWILKIYLILKHITEKAKYFYLFPKYICDFIKNIGKQKKIRKKLKSQFI